MPQRIDCPHCHILLATKSGDQITIRYKDVAYKVTGADTIEAVCRNGCGVVSLTGQLISQ